MTLRTDCVFYEVMRPEQFRGYCNKLNRVIKPKDCEGCGWYYLKLAADDLSRRVSKDLTNKIKEGNI